jgi:glycosyltransferase involved in cell wall biosynthesis
VSEFHSGAPREEWLFPGELRVLRSEKASPVTLWTLNVNELHQAPDSELFRLHNQYNIVSWFWELPTIPDWMRLQFERISEVWAPSTFVERTLLRYTDKPVRVMPPVVPLLKLDTPPEVLRDRLGLPHDRVIFHASFDFNSAVSRKNPFAVIHAFAEAFAGHIKRGPVLVMKVLNLPPSSLFASQLRTELQAVGGILIDRTFTDTEFAALLNASDVYVSLHRSEGFGLGLAESMAIGKPVIGTAFSGNLDFMSIENSCLVGYHLREIGTADHAHNPGIEATYTEGALWAEPDVHEAAGWMNALAADSELRTELGMAATKTMAATFSPAAVCERAKRRLADVVTQLDR